jgi:hypothetical protein
LTQNRTKRAAGFAVTEPPGRGASGGHHERDFDQDCFTRSLSGAPLGPSGRFGHRARSGAFAETTLAASEVDALKLQAVQGPVDGAAVQKALAHEHMFVGFLGPDDPCSVSSAI